MDGLEPHIYPVYDVRAGVVHIWAGVNEAFSKGTQIYVCPKFLYTGVATYYFSCKVESEEGYSSSWSSDQIIINDIAPTAVMSTDKTKVGTFENVTGYAHESYLKAFNQTMGWSPSIFYWNWDYDPLRPPSCATIKSTWDQSTRPYKTAAYGSAGTKYFAVCVTNDNGDCSNIAYVEVEVVSGTVINGMECVFDIVEFNDGYQIERTFGGREVVVDDSIAEDTKFYDSPQIKQKTITLTGRAKTRTATHPIQVIHDWRATKPPEFQAMPNDLVSLKYLEENRVCCSLEVEGETRYLLLEDLPRSREHGFLEQRDWEATFIIMEV
jgi:hypothetical protein